jgi:His-Xaa-Ser system protein HxsD
MIKFKKFGVNMEIKRAGTISLDLRIYSKNVILRTANSYSDVVDFVFDMGKDEFEFIVAYKFQNTDDFNHDGFCSEFMKQLLYQSVRAIITEQTQTIKELMIGRALYQTCILASTGDAIDK